MDDGSIDGRMEDATPVSIPCFKAKESMIAHDALLNHSNPPWREIDEDTLNDILVVALLTGYKIDPGLPLAQIETAFKPVFDHIIEEYMIEDGDITRPTAKRVQSLIGSPLYNSYKRESKETLDRRAKDYLIPRPFPTL